MKEYYEQIDEYLKTYSGRGDVYFKDFEIKTFCVGFAGYMVILLKALAIQAASLGILYCTERFCTRVDVAAQRIFAGFVANLVCIYVVYRSLAYTLYRLKSFLFKPMLEAAALSLFASVTTYQVAEMVATKECLWISQYALPMGVMLIIALISVSMVKTWEAYEQYRDMYVVINSRKYLYNTGTVEQILKRRVEPSESPPLDAKALQEMLKKRAEPKEP